jgi:hypothetical protein
MMQCTGCFDRAPISGVAYLQGHLVLPPSSEPAEHAKLPGCLRGTTQILTRWQIRSGAAASSSTICLQSDRQRQIQCTRQTRWFACRRKSRPHNQPFLACWLLAVTRISGRHDFWSNQSHRALCSGVNIRAFLSDRWSGDRYHAPWILSPGWHAGIQHFRPGMKRRFKIGCVRW